MSIATMLLKMGLERDFDDQEEKKDLRADQDNSGSGNLCCTSGDNQHKRSGD